MADLENNKNNDEQGLNGDGFRFSEDTKDKDVVPFDKDECAKKDEINGEPITTEKQDKPSDDESSERNEDDDVETHGEYVDKADLETFQQYVDDAVKRSKDDIKAFQISLENKIEEKIDEKIKTSTKGPIESVEEKISEIKDELEKYKEA